MAAALTSRRGLFRCGPHPSNHIDRFPMPKTILVTGASGFIGSHTCVELLQSGFDIVALDNLCNSSREALERVRKITGRDFPFVEADIRDRAALDAILAQHRIDSVIHFAGLKAV